MSLLESLTGLRLRDPGLLLLALALPLALWLRRRRGPAAVSFAPAPLLQREGLPRSWRQRLLPLPRALQLVGLLLVVLALARPVHRIELPRASRGIDIVLCVDTSSSMTARDMDPRRSRLDLARQAAAAFVDGRAGDRIALVRFARYPDLLCPLTLDHRTVGELLDALQPVERDGPEDQTGIGTAVARAVQVLRDSAAPSKVVILLTDGEENVATARTPDEIGPARAAAAAADSGVRVYTIAAGVGKRDRTGAWVPLDTAQVERLAERTGGAFFAAREADALQRVYATIDELEKVEFEERRFVLEERFTAFALLGLALLLAARVLAATVWEVLP